MNEKQSITELLPKWGLESFSITTVIGQFLYLMMMATNSIYSS
jgi:hypothetical protein